VTTNPPRQRKTPQQRAEETLATAQRIRDRLHKQARKARAELEALDRELAGAEARLDYAKKNPDLPKTPSTTSTTTGTTRNQSGATA
jgi:hypothetical protein